MSRISLIEIYYRTIGIMIMELFVDRKIPRPVESHLSKIMKPLFKFRMNEKFLGWCSCIS